VHEAFPVFQEKEVEEEEEEEEEEKEKNEKELGCYVQVTC
jgi:hypothetical protein